MPMSTSVVRGNLLFSVLCGLNLTPLIVAANTTAEQLFPFPGLLVGDFVNISKPTSQAGLGIVNVRALANQVGITFSNNTAAGITPTAGELYTFGVDRYEDQGLPLPTGIT